MSVVCDTDSEEGIGPIKLLMEAYKLVGADIKTEFVLLEDIQGLNEDYIKYLYGKTPKEMAAEGVEAAKQIWRQKHPDSDWNELLDVKAPSETPSDGLDAEGNSEKSLKDEVSPAMGSLAVKTVEVSPVRTNEVGVNSSALVVTKEVMESIGAIRVNDSVGLSAVEPAKKPAETDKVSAAPADLPAAKLVENPVVERSMETNETYADILPEDFKIAIDSFKQLAEDNNNQFFAKAQYITGELDRLRGLIKYNPTAMNNPAISEMIISTSGRIRDLEASRAESVEKFKNDINSLLEGLKSKIENDDERRRLVKLTEHVDQMGVDNVVLGEVTNDLLDKLIRIRRYIEGWQNDRWGADGYKSNISQVIGEIISDLSTASRRRLGIVGDVEGIKREGYYQKR